MTELRSGALTIADLDSLPEECGTRYELFDGALYVSRQPHHEHQAICAGIAGALWSWNRDTRLGRVFDAPGLIFSERDAAAPDVAWASHGRLARIAGPEPALHGAPELVVEVLSPGAANQRRDRELKLRVYSTYGVDEYWLVDLSPRAVEIYRRYGDVLKHVSTLGPADTLTSPLLPSFALKVEELFQ